MRGREAVKNDKGFGLKAMGKSVNGLWVNWAWLNYERTLGREKNIDERYIYIFMGGKERR